MKPLNLNFLIYLLIIISIHDVLTFTVSTHTSISTTTSTGTIIMPVVVSNTYITQLKSSAPSDVDDNNYKNDNYSDDDKLSSKENSDEIKSLKLKLLSLCASYDRGFGASSTAQQNVNDIVSQLISLNPTPYDAARGMDGNYIIDDDSNNSSPPPLKGIWQMIWTNAFDVVTLNSSPILTPSAIYQMIDPSKRQATNIIDFIPRVELLLPRMTLAPSPFPSMSSLLRVEVKTKTSIKKNNNNNTGAIGNRVGLDFEAVTFKPVEILGRDVTSFCPPLNINFPKLSDLYPILSSILPGVVNVNDDVKLKNNKSPGFFDVVYLDDEMLIIQQNAPGGYFVSVKVHTCDP